jgi:hypothetical protein
MAINTNLLNALNRIVSKHGGVKTLSDAKWVKGLLADLAADEPRAQKNALIFSLEHGFVAPLQNVPAHERGHAKAKLAERLSYDEGLAPALCVGTLDLLEAALFGSVSAPTVTAGPAQAATTKPTVAALKSPAPSGGYYLSINYQQSGPFTLEQVKSMAGSGSVAKNHWVRNGDKSDWLPVPKLPELQQFFANTGNVSGKGNVTEPAVPKNQAGTYGAKPQPVASARQDSGAWRELQVLEGHTKTVYSVAHSPDGRRIASGSADNIVMIWEME